MVKKATTKRAVIFVSLMAVLAGAMVMCSQPDDYPEEPQNIKLLEGTTPGNNNKWEL